MGADYLGSRKPSRETGKHGPRGPRPPTAAMEPKRVAVIQCKVWATAAEMDGLSEQLRREHSPMWVEEK